MQTTFADTILNIALTGDLIRIDLRTITPVHTSDEKQALRANPNQQVVMPIEGCVRAFGMQERIIKKLVAEVVLEAKSTPKHSASVSTGTTTKT